MYGSELRDEVANSVQLTSDGGYVVAGYRNHLATTQSDMYVIKTGVDHSANAKNELFSDVPQNYILFPPFPNPFNPVTEISYDIPIASPIIINIYNVLGHNIITLFDGIQQPGQHTITWNATNIPSGIYFCRMSARIPSGDAGEFKQVQKIILIK